jgi:hypothetical protein
MWQYATALKRREALLLVALALQSQHASACVSMRQHASAYVSMRQHASACVSKAQLLVALALQSQLTKLTKALSFEWREPFGLSGTSPESCCNAVLREA